MLDTNVVLDVLQARTGFVDESQAVFEMVEANAISGLLCATTITTLAYLAAKTLGRQQAARQTRQLLTLFEVAPVNRAVLDGALKSKAPDFEDAVGGSGPARWCRGDHHPQPARFCVEPGAGIHAHAVAGDASALRRAFGRLEFTVGRWVARPA